MIDLRPHHVNYAVRIHELASDPLVSEALGLVDQTLENRLDFIQKMQQGEKEGTTCSRLVFHNHQMIGVTTLMYIDQEKKSCHLGSWLGVPYWGRGYNERAKVEILKIAFDTYNLDRVFLGARIHNFRSQAAQQKLPYIKLNVMNDYPEEHQFLQEKEQQPCVLNVVEKEDFYTFLNIAR